MKNNNPELSLFITALESNMAPLGLALVEGKNNHD
jgi:hypothetical protein